ncbi:MAG: AMP-binding protein, partial [Spirochaetota bacterium]
MRYKNIAECCSKIVEQYAENTLYIYEGQTIKYRAAGEQIRTRAAMLQKEGFRCGDVIGILIGNSPEWGITFMAVSSIGAIVLPLDTGLSADKYDEMLSAVDAKAVFVAKAFADIPTSVRKIPAELGMPSADA